MKTILLFVIGLFVLTSNAEVLGIASRLTERDKIPDSKPVNYQCTVDMVYTKISTHRHWIETTALEMMAP